MMSSTVNCAPEVKAPYPRRGQSVERPLDNRGIPGGQYSLAQKTLVLSQVALPVGRETRSQEHFGANGAVFAFVLDPNIVRSFRYVG